MAESGFRKPRRRGRKRARRPVRVALVGSRAGIPREVEEALRLHPDIAVGRRVASVREALSKGKTPDVVVADGLILAGVRPMLDEAEPEGLTRREREVVALIATGRTSREIAEILRVTTRTVESHREHVGRKLGTRTIAGLTRFAIAHGLLEEP